MESLQFPHGPLIESLQIYIKVDARRKDTDHERNFPLLVVIVVLGLFAATGYTGYRYDYAQGIQTAANSSNALPGLRPFNDFGPRGMPMHRFGFERGWEPGGYQMMGFRFFSPWILLWHIAVFALIVWFIYWLFARSGCRLTGQPMERSSSNGENE